MRSSIFIISVAVLWLAGCKHPGKPPHQPAAGNATAIQIPEGDFYRRYEGTIGGRELVLQLHRYGRELHGSYQFKDGGRAITVTDLEDTTEDNTLYLSELASEAVGASGQKGPHWSLQLQGNAGTGSWSSSDNASAYEIRLQEVYPAGSFPLQAWTYTDTAGLFPGRNEPHAYVTYGMVAPVKDAAGPDPDYIATAVSSLFHFGAPGPRPDYLKGLQGRADQYFAKYRQDLSGLVDSNAAPEALESFIYQYYTTEHLYVLFNAKGWLVLEDVSSDYTGGAHGNYGSCYLNLDVTGRRAWGIGDIVQDTSLLGPQLQAAARDYFQLQPGQTFSDRLLVREIPSTPNFYLGQTGITFVYNPYEIASYADGEVDLFLPYSKLMPLLTPAFKERMGLQERSGIAMR